MPNFQVWGPNSYCIGQVQYRQLQWKMISNNLPQTVIKGKKQSKTASELISPAKFLLPTLVWLVPIDTCVQCIRTVQESLGSLLPHIFLKDSTKPAKVKQKPAQQPLGRNHKPTGFWQKPNLFTCISVLFDLWHNSHEGWKSASLERGPWKWQWWLPRS